MRIRRNRIPKRLPRRKSPPPPEIDNWQEDVVSPSKDEEELAPETEPGRSEEVPAG